MAKRDKFLEDYLCSIDGFSPRDKQEKHVKMSRDPFLFFRGSAQLFYFDIKSGMLNIPRQFMNVPHTLIMGDCHLSNFGFFTEEGSHGDNVIFAPNDFDDACVGPAVWDICRFLVSLRLAVDYGDSVASGCLNVEDGKFKGKVTVGSEQLKIAMDAFLNAYIDACERSITCNSFLGSAIENFSKGHIMEKLYNKAVKRSAGGQEFELKSSLAKAISWNDNNICFNRDSTKYNDVNAQLFEEIVDTFAPYVDDSILDVVARAGAGTGSLNLERYYLLVGPNNFKGIADLPLCHLVEVKQQRKAAPLYHFDNLSPVNKLNPAHLTAQCQRRMQRNADLVLDEVIWRGKYWLVRSRHHAKVGVTPEKVVLGKKAVIKAGFEQFAKDCGRALALAHCRGDKRSKRFELAIVDALKNNKTSLLESCNEYAKQVAIDTHSLQGLVN